MHDYARLSRTVAHALRHAPWVYELEIDDEGWAPVDQLLDALRDKRERWRDLDRSDFVEMIRRSDKRRYEIEGNRIRALYGHSLPGRLSRRQVTPPERLYHGTAPAAAATIPEQGLRPMGRQYVHLSATRDDAVEVGRRKASEPVILEVGAAEADAAGVRFYEGNEHVWLADRVPARFVEIA
jgi:putative RNA 2'-phosphotransferase